MTSFKYKLHQKMFLSSILLFAGMFYAKQGHAYCEAVGTANNYVDLNGIIAQRDAPVGTVLATRTFSSTGKKYGSCDSGGGYQVQYFYYAGAKPTALANVYASGVPGVGISIESGWYAGYFYTSPPTYYYYQGPVGVYDGSPGSTIRVVKTGDITSGSFVYGMAAQAAMNNQPVLNFYITGGSVTQVACSITTPNLTFPIGNVLASKFGSSVGTIPAGAQNTQNLGLNCDANANINVTLSGTQNADVSDTSVLALTGQGSSDVASGVGVQLLYNNSPLKLNNRIVLKKSSGGQETFPLVARYYQTKSTVTTGKANASATLDLTYQ